MLGTLQEGLSQTLEVSGRPSKSGRRRTSAPSLAAAGIHIADVAEALLAVLCILSRILSSEGMHSTLRPYVRQMLIPHLKEREKRQF